MIASWLAKWRALPDSDRRLLLEALRALLMTRLALRLRPLTALKREPAAERQTADPGRIAWAVRVAARAVPGSACLAQALAVQRMLAVRGRSSELELGVAKEGGSFGAHAWLVCDGQIVIGGEEAARFVRLEAP